MLFLDIDGPFISRRAGYLDQSKVRDRLRKKLETSIKASGKDTSRIRIFDNLRLDVVFDPVAVSIVNHILKKANAKFVVHSGWSGYFDRTLMKIILKDQGIDCKYMHLDWTTPKKMSSHRGHEVGWWLNNHPEVNQFAIIDNDSYSFSHWPRLKAGFIEIPEKNGILYEHIDPILKLLGVFKEQPASKIDPDAWRGCIP